MKPLHILLFFVTFATVACGSTVGARQGASGLASGRVAVSADEPSHCPAGAAEATQWQVVEDGQTVEQDDWGRRVGSPGAFREIVSAASMIQALQSSGGGIGAVTVETLDGASASFSGGFDMDLVIDGANRRLRIDDPAQVSLCGDALILDDGDRIASGPLDQVSFAELRNSRHRRVFAGTTAAMSTLIMVSWSVILFLTFSG